MSDISVFDVYVIVLKCHPPPLRYARDEDDNPLIAIRIDILSLSASEAALYWLNANKQALYVKCINFNQFQFQKNTLKYVSKRCFYTFYTRRKVYFFANMCK